MILLCVKADEVQAFLIDLSIVKNKLLKCAYKKTEVCHTHNY